MQTSSSLQTLDLDEYNHLLQNKTPIQIIEWVAQNAQNPILTTNFRPQTSAILHLVTQVIPNIPVLWVDTGYNLDSTIKYAEAMTERLNLNLKVFHPEQSDTLKRIMGNGIPALNTPEHDEFTKIIKLEPFKNALESLSPDAWITGIRAEQTEFRQSLDTLSRSAQGILKVAPIYNWSKQQQLDYIKEHDLPDEQRYFDPTKAEENRECGLHTQL